MTDPLLELIAAKASLPPRLLGGPAAVEGGVAEPCPDDEVARVLEELGRSGRWRTYTGRGTESLTARLAADHGIRHGHLCASGTAAVELALRGLGLGPGDEVVLGAYDFRGNFGNVCLVGATPVLVDIREEDGQFDVERVAEAMTSRTKAILVSHLHGGVVDMPKLRELADARKVTLVEDVCQSPGASVGGRMAGTWGDVALHSFGGSKLLSAGRGGAVLTSRDDVIQRIRIHVNRGNDAYPMSEVQAAILLPQWESLRQKNAARARRAERLCGWLNSLGVSSLRSWVRQFEGAAMYRLAFWYDPRRCRGLTRDQFAAAVQAEGVPLAAGFRALHLSHARRRFRAAGALSNAAQADANLLTLHHSAFCEDDASLAAIAAGIAKVERQAESLLGIRAASPSATGLD